MKFLRYLLILLIQFVVVTALVVAGCIAWTLNDRGVSYAETEAFRDDLVLWSQVGMAAAAIYCLILLCYKMTSKSLDAPDDGWHY